MTEPDYSSLPLEELLDVLEHIDRSRHPERTQRLLLEIGNRRAEEKAWGPLLELRSEGFLSGDEAVWQGEKRLAVITTSHRATLITLGEEPPVTARKNVWKPRYTLKDDAEGVLSTIRQQSWLSGLYELECSGELHNRGGLRAWL